MALTVAAVSTPMAPGGLGVLRVSGPQAVAIADLIFKAKNGKPLARAKGYTAHFGRVCDADGAVLDEAVATVFRAPHSFTGEDVVELSCHGGPFLLRRVLAALLAAGASPAGPGEFTRRAFENGKMDLAQAEAVMELIGAQGEQALRAARAGQDGMLSRRIAGVREELLLLAGDLAAWADYPDDDVPQVDEERLDAGLAAARQTLTELLASFETGRLLREGVDTVIAGKPNAGKSSLMNLLSGGERSIVTDVAGTTRDVVEEPVQLGGLPLRLADTAGIRRTDDPVERIGVERALRRLQNAQLVLAVFDLSRPPDADDEQLLAALGDAPCVAVFNKCDLAADPAMPAFERRFPSRVRLCAKTGEGLDELTRAAVERVHADGVDPAAGILFTERQRDAARRAQEAVTEALEALRGGMTLDAVTVSLEAGLAALFELTGERVSDAVVDSVFERFCVGK